MTDHTEKWFPYCPGARRRRRRRRRRRVTRARKGNDLESFRTNFEVKKIDEELGIVFGWASVSQQADGTLVFDHEGDAIFPEELEKAAYDFNLEVRKATDSHDMKTLGVGNLCESMVFTKDKQAKLGITLPIGWWVGFKVNDDLRKKVRDTGERAMFSIGGRALRTEI